MKERNICKFITSSDDEKLEMHNFIYETDDDIMKSEVELQYNCVYLVVKGCGKFHFDGYEIPFTTGSLVFGFYNERFSVETEDICEYMYISFGGSRSDSLFRRFGINKQNRKLDDFDSVIPLWRDSLARTSHENVDLTSEGVLLYTFSRINGITKKQNNLINDIIELSEAEFSNPDFSLSLLSDTLGYNSKYLSHFFKEHMGVTYSEYLRTLRIKYAVLLFEHGIESVKNVAYLSGFSDPLYFSTVFKKTIGVAPRDFRLRNKE